jgi:uncharacterized protein (TIGR01777 family)
VKQIVIFGGTGFIGRHLIDELKDDYKIIVFSRNPSEYQYLASNLADIVRLDLDNPNKAIPFVENAEGIINLAGENIGAGRWTKSFKNQVLQSRLRMAGFIMKAFLNSQKKPKYFIQGSAIGYYGVKTENIEITEGNKGFRDGFLADVAIQYEEAFSEISNLTRLVFARTGIVLDKTEGALPKMAMPFKMFAGGKVGSGRQWISWIHIKDLVNAIRFIMENEDVSGPVNLTAPVPVTQNEFAKTIGKTLNRPSIMPAPGFALQMLLGKDRANELLLNGKRVVPQKLLGLKFNFKYSTIEPALSAIYKK